MTCKCEHRAMTHRYLITTRENAGECLSPGCPCTALEGPQEPQNAPVERFPALD